MVMKAIYKPDFLREGADGNPEQFMVNSVIAQVGEGTSDPAEGPQLGATPNKGRITVSFLKFQDRGGISTTDVLNAIRNEVKGYPDAIIRATKKLRWSAPRSAHQPRDHQRQLRDGIGLRRWHETLSLNPQEYKV